MKSVTTGNPQSAGIKMPPKFVPKIPTIKKEKVIEKEPIVATEKSRERDGHRVPYSQSGPGRGRGHGREDDRGRGGGRGRWVMPTGQAFFSANQSVSTDSKNIKKEDEKRNEKQPMIKAGGPVSVKISRPNEDIFSSFQPNISTQVKTDVSSESMFFKHFAAAANEQDSDEDFLSNADAVKAEEGTEVWPPREYDPLGPLELPFGPRTMHTRTLLSGETILAHPQDKEAVEREQLNTLFLFQMPSELRFEKLSMDSNERSHSAPSQQDSEKIQLVDRKLGKLQMLKSGKVRLVTSWGRIYELHPGMAVSFAQYLASISVNTPTAPAPPPSQASSTQSFPPSQPPKMDYPEHLSHIGNGMLNRGAAGSGRGTASHSAPPQHSSAGSSSNPNTEDGDIHFLGFVTKKVVLTSHYQLDDEAFPLPVAESFLDDADSFGKPSELAPDERPTHPLKGAGPGPGPAGRGRGFAGRGPVVGRGPGSASRMAGRVPNLSKS